MAIFNSYANLPEGTFRFKLLKWTTLPCCFPVWSTWASPTFWSPSMLLSSGASNQNVNQELRFKKKSTSSIIQSYPTIYYLYWLSGYQNGHFGLSPISGHTHIYLFGIFQPWSNPPQPEATPCRPSLPATSPPPQTLLHSSTTHQSVTCQEPPYRIHLTRFHQSL